MRFISVALVLLLIRSPLFGQDLSTVREIVDSVNRDSLQSYVERLQAFGTRYEYTPQRDSAAQYVASTFSRWGLTTLSNRYSIGTIWDAALLTKDSLWIVGEHGLLLFSSDGGQTWVEQPSAIRQSFYGIDMQFDRVGIAVGAGGTIVRTTDAGAHWSSVATSVGAYLISVSFGSSTTGVTVGTGGTILRTTTGGVSWHSIPSGTTQDLFDVQFISPSKAIAIGSSGCILRSTDAGETWEKQSSGSDADLSSLSFIDSLNGFVSGRGPTLLKTINGGAAWTPLSFPSTQSARLYGIFFADSMHGCVVGDNTRIFSTEDGGQLWQVADSLHHSAAGSYLSKLRGVAGQRMLFLGSSSLVVTSSDNGVTWTDYSNTLPSSVFHESRNIVATIPGSTRPAIECVLVAHYDSYSDSPFASAPGANDNATGTAAVMEAARICSGYRFASTLKLVAVSGEELGLLGSQQYAEAARNENRNIIGVVNADMLGCPFSGDTLNFGVGSFYGRNRLVDSCVAYNQRYGIGLHIITGVDSAGVSDHASFTRYGYDAVILSGSGEHIHTQNDLATALNFGLVRRAAQLMIAAGAELASVIGRATEVERASNSQPKQFLLHQNYPNPFNPTTEIQFSIAKLSIVNLRIFDLLGREVATLVNEQRPGGDYSVKWEAGNLPSGVYFCRLQAGSYSETRKLVLLR
jgi:photosystem II stability/assembly factor-like uncharacterized protein